MSDRRIVSTLDYPTREAWTSRVMVVRPGSGGAVKQRLGMVGAMLRAARPGRVLVVDGSMGIHAGNPDLLVAALLGLLPRRFRPAMVMAEANWKPATGWQKRLRKAGMRAISRGIDVFCVVSRHEEGLFRQTWGLDPRCRIVYTPFYWTLDESELAVPVKEGRIVFAGGNPLRDYATLIEAVRDLDVPVVLATSRPDVVNRTDLPANVTAGRITHQEFVERMREAAVVVVSLMAGTERSGGEQTYLNAMAMGKLVVVSDSPGVRDYVTDGETGIIVPPGDVAAMRAALARALDPANAAEVSRMVEAAKTRAAEFTPQRWVDALLDVADSLLPERPTTA
ncbi:MAG: glycosyltransferase [Thermoleophilia bacterium]